jgi:lipoate-protein ligase A
VEEWLLDRAEAFGPTLFLCRNDPAVVIGKNQNPWREVDLDRARGAGVRVARRVSGGGTVFHDPGNLNYSFIVPRERYDADAQFAAVIRALGSLGIPAEVGHRTNLCAAGRKVSGNAFCLKARVAMHHGTLLVRADLDRMGWLLPPAPPEIESHAVASIPAPVVNLCDLVRDLTMESLERALIESATGMWGGSLEVFSDEDAARRDWEDVWRRHASWEWVYGRTPPFRIRLPLLRRGARAGSVVVRVEDGLIGDLAFDPPEAGAVLTAGAGGSLRFDPSTVAGLFAGHPGGWTVGERDEG